MNLKNVLISISAALFLVGCGGGGSDSDSPCSTASSLFVGFSYKSAGVSSSGNVVAYKPGEAFSVTPTTSGIPASCEAGKRFTIAPQPPFGGPVVNLPASVTLDAATGTIAGTLAVPLGRCYGAPIASYVNTSNLVCDQGGTFESAVFDVTLSLQGFSDLKRSVFFTKL